MRHSFPDRAPVYLPTDSAVGQQVASRESAASRGKSDLALLRKLLVGEALLPRYTARPSLCLEARHRAVRMRRGLGEPLPPLGFLCLSPRAPPLHARGCRQVLRNFRPGRHSVLHWTGEAVGTQGAFYLCTGAARLLGCKARLRLSDRPCQRVQAPLSALHVRLRLEDAVPAASSQAGPAEARPGYLRTPPPSRTATRRR